MLDITDSIAAIRDLDLQVADIIPAITAHATAEPDHAKRGSLLRLVTVLTDFRHNLTTARQQFASSAKHAAEHGLAATASLLRSAMADAGSDDPSRKVIDGMLGRIKTAKAVIGKM